MGERMAHRTTPGGENLSDETRDALIRVIQPTEVIGPRETRWAENEFRWGIPNNRHWVNGRFEYYPRNPSECEHIRKTMIPPGPWICSDCVERL